MKTLLSIKLIFFLLFLFLANSCLDPTQIQGKCKKCQSTQLLENSFCYTKVRGCLIQRVLSCNQCQQGYILTQNTCQRVAQFMNLTSLNPAPQTVQQQKLNTSQITPVFVGGYQQSTNLNSESYLKGKYLLVKQYPFLGEFKIYRVQEQIVSGTNYLFYFVNSVNYDLYLAKVYVGLGMESAVQEIYKNDASIKKGDTSVFQSLTGPVPGGWRQFMTVSDPRYVQSQSLLLKSHQGLQAYKLERVQYQIVAGINFLFFYLHVAFNENFVAKVYRPFYGNSSVTAIWGLTPIQAYKTHSAVKAQQQQKVGKFEVLSVEDYDNQPFLSVKNRIRRDFPDFDNSMIKKVQQQLVAGFVQIVTFSFPNSVDVYEVRIFVPLPYTQLPPQIESIKKNGQAYQNHVLERQTPKLSGNTLLASNNKSETTSISHQKSQKSPSKIEPIYSWQSDPIFADLYKFFKNQINIVNLPVVVQVQRQIKNISNVGVSFWEYKIIYSDHQYAICRYYNEYSIYEVVSYIADSTQVYRLGDRLNVSIRSRTEGVLAEKIKNQYPIKFKTFLIRQITEIKLSEHYKLYKVNGYTQSGHFQVSILDKEYLYVVNVSKLDEGTCFPIKINSAAQYRLEYNIQQIKTFLFSKYSFSGYQMTLATVNSLQNETSQYFILLSRNDLRKVQVMVQQIKQRFIIKKLQFLDDGLYLLSGNNQTKNIEDMARQYYKTQLQGHEKVLSLTNSSIYILKFGNSSHLAIYTKILLANFSDLKVYGFAGSNPCVVKKADSTDTCKQCSENDFLWKGKCYLKLSNCYNQIGSICGVCDKFSILYDGKCLKNCGYIFSR